MFAVVCPCGISTVVLAVLQVYVINVFACLPCPSTVALLLKSSEKYSLLRAGTAVLMILFIYMIPIYVCGIDYKGATVGRVVEWCIHAFNLYIANICLIYLLCDTIPDWRIAGQ